MKFPNFGYHLSRLHGAIVRKLYGIFLPLILRSPVKAPRDIDLDVFAYSGEGMFLEQIASIRSFLKYVGRPKNFVVVSDRSYSQRSAGLLERVDPVVSVRDLDGVEAELPEKMRNYLTEHPMGRQLALIRSLPRERAALYIDSDVRFFPGGNDLVRYLSAPKISAYYLEDCRFSGDSRLLRNKAEEQPAVNAGVLLLFRKLDWGQSLARFMEMEEPPIFFTNQTITHLAMHENGAQPFDPAKYVLQLDDQFVFADRYAGAALALRHYVNPVRHKFWTSLRY
jgi:hypothetical protein